MIPAILISIGSALKQLSDKLILLGPLGLFGICLLDSAFIPLPSGPDLVMMTLTSINPRMMPVYATCATLGSTIGSTVLYSIARKAGIQILKRVDPKRRERTEKLLGRYDMLAIIVPAILPPPFPFKVFILSAGAFRLNIGRFILAVLIGRSIRFLVEGFLAIKFGNEAYDVMRRHGLKVLLFAAAAALILIAVKVYRDRASAVALTAAEADRSVDQVS